MTDYEALAEKKRKTLLEGEGSRKKARLLEEDDAMFELMECMSNGGKRRRRSRKGGKKIRKTNDDKIPREALNCLIDISIKHDEAISLLNKAVLVAPTSKLYRILGSIYSEKGEETNALKSYLIAARASPKDISIHLWEDIIELCVKHNNYGLARYCLHKAISAHSSYKPFWLNYARLLLEAGDFRKAAEAFVEMSQIPPVTINTIKNGARCYLKCGEVERSISFLEDRISEHHSLVDLLLSICMEHKRHDKAVELVERARRTFCESEHPFAWVVKEGICHLHLGNLEKAKMLLNEMGTHSLNTHSDLIIEVGDAYMSLEHYETALKYFLMVPDDFGGHTVKGLWFSKIARCYEFLKEGSHAVTFFYKALNEFSDNIEVRLALASLLVDDSRVDEAISVLSPPKNTGKPSKLSLVFPFQITRLLTCMDSQLAAAVRAEYKANINLVIDNKANSSWWFDRKIILKLSHIYRDRGMCSEFIDTIFSLVRESLIILKQRRKSKAKKQLPLSTLNDRVKLLDDSQTGNVFQGIKPVAPASVLRKAARAKRLLLTREMQLKEKREKALAAGIDWRSDESEDDDPSHDMQVLPLPKLLQDEEHHRVVVDLCEALISSERYGEAIEIINLTLKLAHNKFSNQKKEELQVLAAQTASKTSDPKQKFECAKCIVRQRPYSISAWNFYFQAKLSLGKSYLRNSTKFLRHMRMKLQDFVAPMLITGHQFSMHNQYQIAAKEYLEAHKIMPKNPLINLCVGSALINLTLGFRLQNKHLCIAQGLTFLHQNLLLGKNTQEALYNIARGCHHVGLVSIAASYYEKVLAATPERNHPECDLRREAAHNLHLIYKQSGALDLARQVLRDHCSSI